MAGLLPNGMPACSPNNIMELTHAVERTEMIFNAAKLRVFDIFERVGKPLTAMELIKELGVPESSVLNLERLLTVNASFGLLKRTEDAAGVRFTNTDEAHVYLTTKSDFSLLTLVDAARHQFDIADFIEKGVSDTSRTWFFEADKNEDAYNNINFRFQRYYNKQDGYARTSIHLLKSFDLSGYKTCVDLGGGLGTLARAMKKYYPAMDVTSYDMPKVITMAKEEEAKKNYDVSVKYCEGDLFNDATLPQADLYVIGHLLHMFKDDVASDILKKVHASVKPGGAVLVLEKVMNSDKSGPELCLMYDIRMGFSAGEGKERTREQMDALFQQNGFANGEYKENPGYNCYDAILTHKQ